MNGEGLKLLSGIPRGYLSILHLVFYGQTVELRQKTNIWFDHWQIKFRILTHFFNVELECLREIIIKGDRMMNI